MFFVFNIENSTLPTMQSYNSLKNPFSAPGGTEKPYDPNADPCVDPNSQLASKVCKDLNVTNKMYNLI
jgi:hypothetical protein